MDWRSLRPATTSTLQAQQTGDPVRMITAHDLFGKLSFMLCFCLPSGTYSMHALLATNRALNLAYLFAFVTEEID